MARVRVRLGSFFCWLGCTMAWACAPSHRMVHDGNVYFERCYGADFNERVSPEQREGCWAAWLADYTRHQPAHRIDYAMRRVEAIQAGDQTLKLPGMGGQSSAPSDNAGAGLLAMRSAMVGNITAPTLAPDAGETPVPNGCAPVCRDFEERCLLRCPPETSDCGLLCARDAAICKQGCY